jgi:hypothetical protein
LKFYFFTDQLNPYQAINLAMVNAAAAAMAPTNVTRIAPLNRG